MKRVVTLTIAATLTLWSLAPAHGAPKSKNGSPSIEAEKVLASVDNLSYVIADTAFSLNTEAAHQLSPESHLEGLQALQSDINRIGEELGALEAERRSLAEWEGKALDEILPLLHDAAENCTRAIQTYNSARRHLYATSYMEDTEKISQDASKAAALLHSYLKLAKAHERESALEERLGEGQQF